MVRLAPAATVVAPDPAMLPPDQLSVPVTVSAFGPARVPAERFRFATLVSAVTVTVKPLLMIAVSMGPGAIPPLQVVPAFQLPEATALKVPAVAFTVKFVLLVAVPAAFVTVITPLVAPAGTMAVICVSLSTVYDDANVPLKATALAPMKPVPAMVTAVPVRPADGAKLVMEAAVAVKHLPNAPALKIACTSDALSAREYSETSSARPLRKAPREAFVLSTPTSRGWLS